MSRFQDPAGALRPGTLSLAGLAIATVALVIVAVGPGRAAAAPASIPPAPSSSPALATPTPIPTAVVTAKPPASSPPVSNPPNGDERPIAVDLDTFDGHDVSIEIVDRTGSIIEAASGRPGDNPSADGLVVKNLDARTLQLTWVDFPIDNQLTLFVDEVGGHLRFQLIQPAPTKPTDAVGMDRQLILTFDHAVDASTVQTMIQEGLDT
jgi:hypothetical protein